ncbi:hypothetical protein ccbrp13_01680 [Ktedonobacteria bacterium brp13]|nr:hypothetical protein ccbrp13_01680 [Ktedonobacteria bacterium brp13]
MRRFHQGRSTFARFATEAFASALPVAWAHPGPGGEVSGTWEALHIPRVAQRDSSHGGKAPYCLQCDLCEQLAERKPLREILKTSAVSC